MYSITYNPDRVQRLKDARAEALKEIDALKSQKQQEFAAFEKQYEGSLGSSSSFRTECSGAAGVDRTGTHAGS
jgi:Vacuolar (H+)-ATPase G subunit